MLHVICVFALSADVGDLSVSLLLCWCAKVEEDVDASDVEDDDDDDDDDDDAVAAVAALVGVSLTAGFCCCVGSSFSSVAGVKDISYLGWFPCWDCGVVIAVR